MYMCVCAPIYIYLYAYTTIHKYTSKYIRPCMYSHVYNLYSTNHKIINSQFSNIKTLEN